MAENNDNNVITVAGLRQFLSNLKSTSFYPRSTMDTKLSEKALKNGEYNQEFSTSKLKLFGGGSSDFIEMYHSTTNHNVFFRRNGKTVVIEMSSNGTVLTTANFRPQFKADRIMQDVVVNDEVVSAKFLSDPTINIFSYPTADEDTEVTVAVDEVDIETMPEDTLFNQADFYNLANPVGSIIYINDSWKATTEATSGSLDNIPNGFYIVSELHSYQDISYKTCRFLMSPDEYTLYYCATSQKLCKFANASFVNLPFGEGGGGGGIPGEYTEATETDINSLNYT